MNQAHRRKIFLSMIRYYVQDVCLEGFLLCKKEVIIRFSCSRLQAGKTPPILVTLRKIARLSILKMSDLSRSCDSCNNTICPDRCSKDYPNLSLLSMDIHALIRVRVGDGGGLMAGNRLNRQENAGKRLGFHRNLAG